jgi:hypothetical protein
VVEVLVDLQAELNPRGVVATFMYRKATSSAPISIPGVSLALTTVELDEELEDVLMRTRRGVMPSMVIRTFGQTGWIWLRRSTCPSKTA